MSNFIIPLSSLPTISSITDVQGKQGGVQQAVSGLPFADVLQNSLQNLVSTQEVAQQGTADLALGGSDDLHTGSIDALKFSTAVSFASSLTSSVIRSYNELLRMSI